MIPEWQRHLTQNPVCPHCGKEMMDSWELDIGDDESEQIDCGECEKPYRVSCRVYVKYSTETVEESLI